MACQDCSVPLTEPNSACRCSECCYSRVLCKDCLLREHRYNPFHLVQRWNSSFFEKATLRDLGMVVHLGHGGSPCPVSAYNETLKQDVLVVDVSGYQTATFHFCGCLDASGETFTSSAVQLFKFGIFPASFGIPRSAFTFRVLKAFQMLSQQCKTNAYDFNTYLRRLTNNTFVGEVKVRGFSPPHQFLLLRPNVGALPRVHGRMLPLGIPSRSQAMWAKCLASITARCVGYFLPCMSPAGHQHERGLARRSRRPQVS